MWCCVPLNHSFTEKDTDPLIDIWTYLLQNNLRNRNVCEYIKHFQQVVTYKKRYFNNCETCTVKMMSTECLTGLASKSLSIWTYPKIVLDSLSSYVVSSLSCGLHMFPALCFLKHLQSNSTYHQFKSLDSSVCLVLVTLRLLVTSVFNFTLMSVPPSKT